jgi:hypothetical protein
MFPTKDVPHQYREAVGHSGQEGQKTFPVIDQKSKCKMDGKGTSILREAAFVDLGFLVNA